MKLHIQMLHKKWSLAVLGGFRYLNRVAIIERFHLREHCY